MLRLEADAIPDAAARDFFYGFSPVRGAGPEEYSPAYLQFHTYVRPDRQAYASIAALGYQAPAVRPGLAAFLTAYGRWFFVPGPVFVAGLVLGLGGLVIGKVRRRPDKTTRDVGLLFAASAVLVLIPPAVFATFDWRYQLPQLTLIPVAAILGVAAMGRRPALARRPRRLAARVKHPRARASTERFTAARTATGGRGRRTRSARPG